MEGCKPHPYFKLFNGEEVKMSTLEKETIFAKRAVEMLIKEGHIIGQGMMGLNGEPNDILLFMKNRHGKST